MSYIHLGSYAEGIGGKANGFYRLKEAGIRFPAGIVLRKPDIEDILSGNVDEFQTSVLQMGSCLAIRSSAHYSWVCYDTHSGCLYLNPYKSASQTSMQRGMIS